MDLFINVYTAAEFLSIDCGSSHKSTYTNPLTGTDVIWTPDTTISPDIGKWSATIANVSRPPNMTDEQQYSTLRYFPTTTSSSSSSKALNQSKFCYTLPAIAGNYYLIRASFWYGLPVKAIRDACDRSNQVPRDCGQLRRSGDRN